MPQIGTFIRDQDNFVGQLTTLTLNQDVIIVSTEPSDTENAPDYRVHLFNTVSNDTAAEIGAGWKRTGEKAGEYIALLFDDPNLVQPIRANLFRDDDAGRAWSLHWTRPMKREGRD